MSGLPVVPLNGLNADALGSYLASLGLFSLVARQWPQARACWRNARFCLVGGPDKLDQVVEFVSEICEKSTWTRYDKPWDRYKKEDIKKKTSTRTAQWRALEAEERSLRLFGAHLALNNRIRMNPILGTGGNAGQRKFDRGWGKAVQHLKKLSCDERESLKTDIRAFLEGQACKYLGDFSAGSWFGAGNKIYNHGTKKPFRKGEVQPLAMALACEGIPYFSGGSSRQFGSRRQFKGAFPFVTDAMAPKGEDEVGRIEAEVWAPTWSQPMTEPELRSLFLRGRAELGGKGATSAAAFSVGVMDRGVDAGVAEFRRFSLLHTTSSQTFESRLADVVPASGTASDGATKRALQLVTKFYSSLPQDRKGDKRSRFFGLRGLLEQALVDFSVTRLSKTRTEQAWTLVDEITEVLFKIDQNRTFRGLNVRFQLLPGEWAVGLFREDPPDREARLALALSSLTGTPAAPQFIAHRIGVKMAGGLWEFPDSRAPTSVWSDVGLTENLCVMAEQRVMEVLHGTNPRPPFDAAIRVCLEDIHAWLSGEIDEERMRLWLDRFCVFDWNGEENSEAARKLQHNFSDIQPIIDGALGLYALFRPLASDWLFRRILSENHARIERASTCTPLSRVIAMLRYGDVNAAVEVARAAYRSVGVEFADFNVPFHEPDLDRLLATLIVPVRDRQVLAVFRRWLTPTKPSNSEVKTHE